MSNCGTCRFWGPDDDWKPDLVYERYAYETDEQYTSRVDWSNTRFKTCKKVVHGDSFEVPVAYTMDASGYASSLRTQESFGCNLWEEK